MSSFFLEVFFFQNHSLLSFSFPLLIFFSFSRMRSKGSRFTLGVWGLKVCSLDVAFTSATVRNRPQPSATVAWKHPNPFSSEWTDQCAQERRETNEAWHLWLDRAFNVSSCTQPYTPASCAVLPAHSMTEIKSLRRRAPCANWSPLLMPTGRPMMPIPIMNLARPPWPTWWPPSGLPRLTIGVPVCETCSVQPAGSGTAICLPLVSLTAMAPLP